MLKDKQGKAFAIGKVIGSEKQRWMQLSLRDNSFFEIGMKVAIFPFEDNSFYLLKKIKIISGAQQKGCTIPKDFWDTFKIKDKVRIYIIV